MRYHRFSFVLAARKRASPLWAGPIGSFPASPKYSIVQHHGNRDPGIPSTASFIVAPYSNVPKNSIILRVKSSTMVVNPAHLKARLQTQP